MKFWTEPSGAMLLVHLILSVIPLYWPFALYALLRYLTGHRPKVDPTAPRGPSW